jgi:hypothetical protein
MRSKAFAAGVEDALLGLKYDDSWDGDWYYEYGRLWQVTTKATRVYVSKGQVDGLQQMSFNRCYGREIPVALVHLPSADELGL